MVGRKTEIQTLNRLYDSNKAQFIAVYGRRRVGKTFLIDETFKGRITFRHSGLSPIDTSPEDEAGPLKKQLYHFYHSLLRAGMKENKCPDSWMDAFLMLQLFLDENNDGSRQLIFLDELPWLDTPKSNFISAFEGFWNNWGCFRNNIMLIVCGSATSWISDKLINNHGGLYGRLTYEIKLSPFTLKECEDYFREEGINLSRYDIVQSYMITGGVPYYLNFYQKGLSLPQNIDAMFFQKNAPLKNEFSRLFHSIFVNPEFMIQLVKAIGSKRCGCTKKELIEATGVTRGGTLSNALSALITSDFIVEYIPFGDSVRNTHYKLADPFCNFYLKFMEGKHNLSSDFWLANNNSQSIVTWRGIAFENVCFNHIEQIKKGLGISGIGTVESAWTKLEGDASGTQIDMIIERKDNVINMCEIKFYSGDFAVDKAYDRILRNRLILLSEHTSRKNTITTTLITTFGLKYNEYSGDFASVVTLDDFFI